MRPSARPSASATRIRKDEHLDLVLAQAEARRSRGGAGFDRIALEHCALPEIDVDEVDLSCEFLGRRLAAPLLISAMTGGPARAEAINRHLAEAAEALRIAFAVGSQRVAIEGGGNGGIERQLRALAPSVPLLANLGGAQLAAGWGVDEARRALDMIEADALVIHLNPLQEALQPEGDRRWRGVLAGIEALAKGLPVPVVVKEVGAGISARVARRLVNAGVSVIDVAGYGGTNWAAVEAARSSDPVARQVAEGFANWGLPTTVALEAVRKACPDATVVASGGIRDGIDVAKAIRLGADMVGQAGPNLVAALQSTDAVVETIGGVIGQLRIACFCTGSADLAALRQVPLHAVRPDFEG